MTKESVLNELVELSHHLGDETREYVIIGEGNTSARIDDDTFWIKASGSNLRTIQSSEFVQVSRNRVLATWQTDATDEDVTRILNESRVDPEATARPSVETFLHAVLYELTDAKFMGHTHPVAANKVLCSEHAADITRHIMPDVVVVCGPDSVYVPYHDPGLVLTREVRDRVNAFIERNREYPRVVYLQNHGLIALGQSPRQVENVTQMAVKHASVLAGTYALGGPHFLSEKDISRLHTRPDEEVRRIKFK